MKCKQTADPSPTALILLGMGRVFFTNIQLFKIRSGLLSLHSSIVGSVVECSPATRAARVRFPDDANFVLAQQILENMKIRKVLEAPGIDPGTSRMLSERSTI